VTPIKLRGAPFLRPMIAGLMLIAFLLLGACGTPHAEPAARAPIRLAAYDWPGCYWIDVAFQKGWFAAAGLDVERIDTEGKYFESLDALAAGKIDAMGFSQYDLVRYVAAGHQLVGVATIDYSDGAEALIAQPGIRTLRDLRGKRIALHRGTYLEYLLDVVAAREELEVDSFTVVDRTEEAAIRDLKTGRVDAVLMWEPYATRAQTDVDGARLFSTAELPGLTYNILTLPRAFVTARPRDVEALLRVWDRATRFIRQHPDETFAIIARTYHEPLTAPQVLLRTSRILDVGDNRRAFSYAAGFESLHGSWRRMNDFMMERGLVATRLASPDYLDSRFITAIE
jgi:NitT/TauT family transport system substrate-binding protein